MNKYPQDLFARFNSPLAPIEWAIARAVDILVPEQKDRIRGFQKDFNITVAIDATTHSQWLSAGPTATGHYVRVGLATLERLWLYCYGFTRTFAFVNQRKKSVLTLPHYEEAALALQMLQFAYATQMARSREGWPPDFRQPKMHDEDPYVFSSNKLFTCVVGFFILHEIGHIVLRHPFAQVPPEQSILEEMQADRFACELIMREMPQGNAFAQRATAISTGLTLLSSVELSVHPDILRDHPKLPERLLTFFSQYAPEPALPSSDKDIYHLHFAAEVLHAFAQSAGLDVHFESVETDFMSYFVRLCQRWP